MTTVKNVVRLAASLLGILDKLDAYLAGTVSDEGQAIVETMVGCFNIIENELAVDYLPLVYQDVIETQNGCIEYSNLSKDVAYVIAVFDPQGEYLDVKRLTTKILLEPGTYTIRYAALPTREYPRGRRNQKICEARRRSWGLLCA